MVCREKDRVKPGRPAGPLFLSWAPHAVRVLEMREMPCYFKPAPPSTVQQPGPWAAWPASAGSLLEYKHKAEIRLVIESKGKCRSPKGRK